MSDDEQVHALFEQALSAWTAGDAQAYGACFTPDCDYVSFDGTRAHGVQPMVDSHDKLFRGVLTGSSLVGEIESIRYLSADIALVQGFASVLVAWRTEPPKRRLTRTTVVAVRTAGMAGDVDEQCQGAPARSPRTGLVPRAHGTRPRPYRRSSGHRARPRRQDNAHHRRAPDGEKCIPPQPPAHDRVSLINEVLPSRTMAATSVLVSLAHLALAAVWLGAMSCNLVVVQPRAVRLLGER